MYNAAVGIRNDARHDEHVAVPLVPPVLNRAVLVDMVRDDSTHKVQIPLNIKIKYILNLLNVI